MKYKYKVIRVPDSYIMPAPGGVVTYTSSSDLYKVEEKEAMSLKKALRSFQTKAGDLHAVVVEWTSRKGNTSNKVVRLPYRTRKERKGRL